jgi:hypothetical protein
MKRYAPAAERNSGPIAQVLARELPDKGLVVEVASGTGEHAVFFARQFPALTWQPSDTDLDALASVEAWRLEAGMSNLLSPCKLDAAAPTWPVAHADAIVCVNMTHIAPWTATLGLCAGAGKLLAAGAPLILYGPFIEANAPTAPSNIVFDQNLRERNAAWGLRRAEAVDEVAEQHGLVRTARHGLPANNIMLIYRQTSQNTGS